MATLVKLDTHALERCIRYDGRPLTDIAQASGLGRRSIYGVMKRGGCTLKTLDKLCGALSIHSSEIEDEVIAS